MPIGDIVLGLHAGVGIDLSPDGKTAYYVEWSLGELGKVDVGTGNVTTVLTGLSLPQDVEVDWDTGEIFVSVLSFILLACLAGAAALLTPCVFPMIPITVSFFTKQGEKSSRSPFTFGIVYCLGIILSFTALGVLFTLALGSAGAYAFATHPVTQGLI